MTKQTIVEALHELAEKCEDGYDTLIQDGGSEPTPISVVIDNIRDSGDDLPVVDYAVDGTNTPFSRGGRIVMINPIGYRESIPTYRVVNRGEYLQSQIYAWKPSQHVSDLRDLLREYNEYCQTHDNQPRIDYDLISSADIPDDVTSWPVWVADNYGNALSGNTADDIEVLADVITTYRAQRAESIADAHAETDRVTKQIRREQ